MRRRQPPNPRDPSLGSPPMLEQFKEFRRHQWAAILEVTKHFRDGKKVVFLDAPTGSGKTLIGETVRRVVERDQPPILSSFNEGLTMYVCNNKSLQDQFMSDFPYAALLKGRGNYKTLNHPELWPEVSALDCDKRGRGVEAACSECFEPDSCPYYNARNRALHDFAVLNTSYMLSVFDYTQLWQGRGLVVVDEADELEGELMRHIEVVVTKGYRNWLQIDLPSSVSDMGLWASWCRDVARRLKSKAAVLSSRERKERRRKKSLTELAEKLEGIAPRLNDNWVVDGFEDARRRRGSVDRQNVRFRPVHVRDLAQGFMWAHADRWLLMSATIISAAQMAEDLGLGEHEWAEVNVESTFPPERRPIFLDRHVGPVTRATEEMSRPKLVAAIDDIAADWEGERILVHSHSYALTKYVLENLSVARARFAYLNSSEREGILEKWLETTDGILIAPSFDRGIDLYDDSCRVQVIAKAPFPYLGDKQVKARMGGPGGQVWYTVATIRSIVQATGRVMRSADDWGATYVLDGSIRRLLAENGQLFPEWWREAVVREGLDSQSRELREGFREVASL